MLVLLVQVGLRICPFASPKVRIEIPERENYYNTSSTRFMRGVSCLRLYYKRFSYLLNLHAPCATQARACVCECVPCVKLLHRSCQ